MKKYYGLDSWETSRRRLRPHRAANPDLYEFSFLARVSSEEEKRERQIFAQLGFTLDPGAEQMMERLLRRREHGKEDMPNPFLQDTRGQMILYQQKAGQHGFYLVLKNLRSSIVVHGAVEKDALVEFTKAQQDLLGMEKSGPIQNTDYIETKELDEYAAYGLLLFAKLCREKGKALPTRIGRKESSVTAREVPVPDPVRDFLDGVERFVEHGDVDPDLPRIDVVPHLSVSGEDLTLVFLVGNEGERKIQPRNLTDLAQRAYDLTGLTLQQTVLDFGRQNVTRTGKKALWYLCLVLNAGGLSKEAKPLEKIALSGWKLDLFYDTMEGESICLNGRQIEVGRQEILCDLTIHEMEEGLLVTGQMPRRFAGERGDYALTKTNLSRLTEEERRTMKLLKPVTGDDGRICFAVSQDERQAFETRVLPALYQSRYVRVRKEMPGD